MKTTFGFIGCGNMGGALATSVAKTVGGASVMLCDADAARVRDLADALGAAVGEAQTLAAECRYLFLGVKPQGFPTLLKTLAPTLAARKDRVVLVSMAAGLSLSAVAEMAGGNFPIIRIMPNTPVQVGEGMVLYAVNDAVQEDELAVFLNAMEAAGRLDCIDEAKIDAAGALSGCGPAYAYLFAEALADGAVACGLARDKANLYAAQTLLGAAKLLLRSGKHPGVLKDAVCSPGGTTIAGVHALEEGAFRAAAANAVIAAYDKTLELKK